MMTQKQLTKALDDHQCMDVSRTSICGVWVAADGAAIACDGHRCFVTSHLPVPAKREALYGFDKSGFRQVKEAPMYPDITQVWPSGEVLARFDLRRDLLPKGCGGSKEVLISILPGGEMAFGVYQRSLVSLNLRYLLDLPGDCLVKVYDAMSPVLFEGADWQAIIMPMRLDYKNATENWDLPLRPVAVDLPTEAQVEASSVEAAL